MASLTFRDLPGLLAGDLVGVLALPVDRDLDLDCLVVVDLVVLEAERDRDLDLDLAGFLAGDLDLLRDD